MMWVVLRNAIWRGSTLKCGTQLLFSSSSSSPSTSSHISCTSEQQSSPPSPPQRVYQWPGDDVENVEEYRTGGYYPVDIADEIKNGRYHIVHKLGYGSYSTVWLAQDRLQDRFVSLKFLRADAEKDTSEGGILRHLAASERHLRNHPGHPFVVTLLDDFEVQSANGSHRCLVTEPVGPSVASVKYESRENRLPGRISRIVAAQCVKGVGYLHSCGVVHGDLHSGNILFKIVGLDRWTVKQAYRCFGTPDQEEIQRIDGQSATPAAPKYIVRPPHPSALVQYCMTDACSIKIVDFGEAFLAASAEAVGDLHTPVSIAAPEIIFKDAAAVGMPVDIWALACTVYEILGDRRLLESFMADRDENLLEMVRTLGKLPDKWWGRWDARQLYFEENGTFKPNCADSSGEPRTVDMKERVRRLIRDTDGAPTGDLDPEECLVLEQMLGGMLRYEPGDRIQARELVGLLPATWNSPIDLRGGE